MEWMVDKANLDIVQLRTIEKIMDNLDGNHWVKGFAGSGKTIVLTHVLERLAAAKPPLRICFATFTHALKDLVESGLSENAKRRITISTFDSLKNLPKNFDIVLADEMQDIKKENLPIIDSIADSMVIAADHDQSIYKFAASPAELTSTIKPSKDHQLREVYRFNENIFDIATSVYDEAKIVDQTTVRQDPTKTKVLKAASKREEFLAMYQEAVRVSAKGSPSAILLPTKTLIDDFIAIVSTSESYRGNPPSVKESTRNFDGSYSIPFEEVNEFLKTNKSPLQVFGGGGGDLYETDKRKMILLMTYHSAKGLDFPYVFLPHLTSKTGLNAFKGGTDSEERRLFFVASTRARDQLYLSYHGEGHRFLDEIPDELLETFKKKRTY
jgi:superfamily I DNA/RNA helicase